MKNKKLLSKLAFDKQAKTYDQSIKGSHARQLYPHMLQNIILCFGTYVLDVGCGTGELMSQVISEDTSRKVVGIDLSSEMLKVAKEKIKDKGKLLLADVECLPFDDQSFDIVYCNDSFHHYPHPQVALSEMSRVLKPQGTIIIGDCYQRGIGRWIMNILMPFSHEGDVKIYSQREMKEMMSVDFLDIEWKLVNSRAFIVKGRKKE